MIVKYSPMAAKNKTKYLLILLSYMLFTKPFSLTYTYPVSHSNPLKEQDNINISFWCPISSLISLKSNY